MGWEALPAVGAITFLLTSIPFLMKGSYWLAGPGLPRRVRQDNFGRAMEYRDYQIRDVERYEERVLRKTSTNPAYYDEKEATGRK